MKTILRSAVALASLAMLAGCSGLITGGDLIRSGEATGTIEVVNDTGGTLDVVLISSCDASTYGLDRLGDTEVIPLAACDRSRRRLAAGTSTPVLSEWAKRASA